MLNLTFRLKVFQHLEKGHLSSKPGQYIVRNYVKGDEVSLARNFSECFGPTTPSRLMRWYRDSQARPEKDVFIGEVDGKLVSSVEVVFKKLHHGEGVFLETAGISGVCTDSDYRRRGILSNVMKLALEDAKQRGVSNMSLYTGLDMSAHRIYLRLGFVDINTFRTFRKYFDFPSVFARWLTQTNRSLKMSKIAARKLKGWNKSVAIQLKDVGFLSFRFTRNHFERLKKPPKCADIEFSTDLYTYLKIMRAILLWEDAVKEGKLSVKRGEPADIEMFKRILHWSWDD
jgi:GNAT superfamily N-acetyltransferase